MSSSPSAIASATSNTFNVIAGSPAYLSFNIQPSTNCNGGTLNNFSISMRDIYGNTIVTSGSFTVTLSVTGTSSGATVSPNTAFGNTGTTGTISGYTFTAPFAGLYEIVATTNYAGTDLSGTSATFVFDVRSIDINDPTIPASLLKRYATLSESERDDVVAALALRPASAKVLRVGSPPRAAA